MVLTTRCCSAVALTALSVVSLSGSEKKTISGPLSLIPARTVWTLALNNQITVPPVFDKERMYFAIDGDRMVAYTLNDGEQQWLVTAKPLVQPAVGDETIFSVESEAIVARRVTDGSTAWQHASADPPSAAPVWAHGWLVVSTSTNRVVVLRATDGEEIWTRDLGSTASAAPVVAADRVYVPTTDGRIVALQVESGEPIWERRLGDAAGDIVVVDNRLYVGSKDNFLYCIMTKDGRVDWRWRTGGDIVGLPAVDAHHIYVASRDNVLRSLDRITGAQQWMRPLPVRPVWGPVIVVDRVLVGGQSQTLHGFNTKDGQGAGTLDAGAQVAAAPHVVGDPAVSLLPVVMVVTRDLAKGAGARLVTRRIEPQGEPLGGPLPNVIKMGTSATPTLK